MELEILFPEDFEKRYKAYKAKLLRHNTNVSHQVKAIEKVVEKEKLINEVVDRISSKKSSNVSETSVIEKAGIGFLLYNEGEIEIGPIKNIAFKLLEVLCPLGKDVSINAVFDKTTSDRSKHKGSKLLLPEKKEKLQNRIKELQEILSKKKIKIRLKFKDSDETVFMEIIK